MKILLTGADGFLGRHLARALMAEGHEVTGCGRGLRRPSHMAWVEADFTRDRTVADWLPKVAGFDAVVNSVGILRERGGQTFTALHNEAPSALFKASAQAGVKNVIQISALGADAEAASRYHLSKRAADERLMALDVDWVVIRPAPIYGDDGNSAGLFRLLASLPWVPLPGDGRQAIRPPHVDDIAEAVVRLLRPGAPSRVVIEAVGSEALTLREYLLALRRGMGLPPTLTVPGPRWLMTLGARVGDLVPPAYLCSETLAMLNRHCPGDPAAFAALLGRSPRRVEVFIAPDRAAGLRLQARLGWTLPVLRLSIAAVWLLTAWISAFVYPERDSLALLAKVGIDGPAASLALYGGAALDAVIGLAVLILPPRNWLGWLQAAVIGGYSALIAWKLPEFLSHPFGPILKHLPMLAGILVLTALGNDKKGARKWTT